jgi:hypothetical protein
MICRLRRVFSINGSFMGVLSPPLSFGSYVMLAERGISSKASEVWGCDLVSVVRRTRSGALWRASHPFADY